MASSPYPQAANQLSNVPYSSEISSMALAYGGPGNLDLNAPKAGQACLSCRRQKRRCDKALPGCSLCVRMNRHCDYSTPTSNPTADDFNALRQKLHELESRLNVGPGNGVLHGESPYTPATTLSGHSDHPGPSPAPIYIQQDPAYTNIQNRFPAIFILDSEAAKYGNISIPKPSVDIPVQVLELLGDGSAVQAVITDYFETVHIWWPIISRKRMTRNMLNPMWEAGPDLALLFLSMKLMITRPQDGLEPSQNHVYAATKRFLALLEASGVTTLLILQAYVLITVYEMSQAMYPAAWMSAGACVRYGLLLGVNEHEAVPRLLGYCHTWTEREERKRIWWAVLILDRLVTLGGQGRSFSSEDPGPELDLPIDTKAWDDGDLAASPVSISGGIAVPRTPFARLCQAAILLGKVLRHHYSPLKPESYQFQHASELYREVSELTRILAAEAQQASNLLEHAGGHAVCFSALAALCDPYACTAHRSSQTRSAEEVAMTMQGAEGLKHVSSSSKEFAERLVTSTPHSLDIDRVSPFIMDSIYCAAANYAWIVRESGDEDSQGGLEILRHCLRRLGSRYRLSSEYLRILEAQEFTYAMGSGGP